MCQCTKSHSQEPGTLTQPSYRQKCKLMPEAVCCCLQTCKCRFDIRVVLRTSVPSLIVRNANPIVNSSMKLEEDIAACNETRTPINTVDVRTYIMRDTMRMRR